jgi:hypothetical protein
MSPDLEFLKLPWEIQGALASGYAAYAVAYTGLRDRQRPIDIAFISLVFSVPATLVFWLLASKGPSISIPAAFVAAVGTGIVWRRFIRRLVFSILKKLDVTWSNDDPSALATLSDNSKFPVSQIAVLLDDGTWLRCDDVSKFIGAPFAPYLLGPNGDVALYLTHEEPSNGEAKVLKSVRDSYYGDRITYVPAARIKQITIRHKSTTASHSSTAVVVEAAQEQSKQEPTKVSVAP